MRTLLTMAAAAVLAGPAAAQVVHGRVLAAEGDTPVAGALVRLVPEDDPRDSVSVWADSLGGFALRAPDNGDYRIHAARLGLREARSPEFELRAGDSLEVVVRLSADTVLLNPVQVVATARHRPARVEEFHRRAERGASGWFVSRREMERRRPVRTTDLLWTAPGIRLTPGRGSGYVVRGRGGCIPAVYLDGMRIGAGAIDLWTTPDRLEGIEGYSGPGAPVEYDGRGCAVVLLWSRA